MGLDQYAFACQPDKGEGDDGEIELMYWRKHADLEGWMANLYRAKGGTGMFNCEKVFLTLEDLDQLEDDVLDGALPHTTGFFFGATVREECDPPTLEFISKARDAIAEGMVVYYTSCW